MENSLPQTTQDQQTQPVESGASVPSIPQPKSKKPFLLIGIITALVLIMTGAGAYFLNTYKQAASLPDNSTIVPPSKTPLSPTSTPQVTTQWKLYTNDTHNYSIQYPPDWNASIDVNNKQGDETILITPNNQESFDTSWGGVNLKSNVYIRISVSKETANCQRNSRINPGTLLIAGIEGTTGKDQAGDGKIHLMCAAVAYNGSNYEFTFNDKDYNREKLFHQIVTTLKFTESGNNNATWNTYTSKKLPENSLPVYSLQYPKDWRIENKRTDEVLDALTIQKKDHTITLEQGPYDGGMCIFNDTPNSEVYLSGERPGADLRDKTYVDITTMNMTFRRYSDIKQNDKKLLFNFCSGNLQTKLFGAPTRIGIISYSIPQNFSNDILLEMDSIIKTLKIIQ